MEKQIKKSKLTVITIAGIAILLMLGVWPFGIIHKTYETGSNAFAAPNGKEDEPDISTSEEGKLSDGVIEGEPSTEEHKYMQVFVSDGTKLERIDIFVCNDVSGQMLDFDIYDGKFERVFHQAFVVDEDAVFPGYVSVTLRPELGVGVPYIFTLYSEDGEIVLGLEDHYATGNTSMYPTNFDGMEDEAHNIVCNLRYTVEYSAKQAVIIDVVISIIAIVLILIVLLLFGILPRSKGRVADKSVRLGDYLRIVIVVLMIIALIMVYPICYWGSDAVDIVFSDISILMLAGLLIYILSGKRRDTDINSYSDTCDRIDHKEGLLNIICHVWSGIRRWLTPVSIGIVLWYCGEYMNGLVDIVHYYMARRILIWFLIMLITTYSREEIINIYNGIWLVAGSVIGYFYSRPYIGLEEEELLYKLNARIILIGGFIIINLIINILNVIKKKTETTKVFIPYAVPCAVFFAGLVVLAHTRWWPAYLGVMMGLLVFRLIVWKDSTKWLVLLCDGIIINFLMMMLFSLIHRPYHTYIYHRYNMVYFTVTMTATHLTMSLAAAACKLYVRYRQLRDKGRTLRRLIPDLMLFGAVASYAVFTLSRTAYAAIVVMVAVMLIAVNLVYSDRRTRIRECLKYIVAMLLATIILFPITFSATRMIPAVFDDPVIYAYEPSSGTIYKGTHPSDERYMNIHRFIEVFGSKVLNTGDTITDAGDVVPKNRNKKDIFIQQDQILLAAADIEAPKIVGDIQPNIEGATQDALLQLASADGDAYGEDEPQDATNGRLDIFKSYIEQSNLWGHDTMGAILKDGTESGHAHNIYLQAIFDHGWVFGIYFAVFLTFSWFVGIIRMYQNRKNINAYDILVPTLLTGFMTAGMAEWIFHPCNPFGLAVCMAIVSMVFKDKV